MKTMKMKNNINNSFLTNEAKQLLVSVSRQLQLSTGWTSTERKLKPLIQNAATRSELNAPKFSHTTPLIQNLHWLTVAAVKE